MERHKCKLCSRCFSNGRALGGHMKAHLATLPPKTQSFSYSSSSDSEQEQEQEPLREESLTDSLRENPKKNFRVEDPEDRESETESKNPTRQRSKRNRTLNLSFVSTPPQTEPEPVSSVSDTSPEEDLAMCLIMLSRDTWNLHTNAAPPKTRCTRRKHLCHNCSKAFRSSPALATHTTICSPHHHQGQNTNTHSTKLFQCPFCYKVFASGQALGGHKRSHLIPSSSSSILKLKQHTFIDLNLPAPPEHDDLSVLSDA